MEPTKPMFTKENTITFQENKTFQETSTRLNVRIPLTEQEIDAINVCISIVF